MNNELFNRARALYQARDYQGALSAFSQCLQDGARLAPGEMGLLYHQIGNCLIKLKDPGEAIHAYTQATADAAKRSGTESCPLCACARVVLLRQAAQDATARSHSWGANKHWLVRQPRTGAIFGTRTPLADLLRQPASR